MNLLRSNTFVSALAGSFAGQAELPPWEILRTLNATLLKLIPELSDEFKIDGDLAIHRTAMIEKGAMIKGPVIIGPRCFIGAHAYLRGGVYLCSGVSIGPACEIKSSMIFDHSSVAHFNFIGDSIIGSHVNFEAGAVIANHYNERTDKRIFVKYEDRIIDTGREKFGALVGDLSKIGANAVLSPVTILPVNSIIKRLELVDQMAG